MRAINSTDNIALTSRCTARFPLTQGKEFPFPQPCLHGHCPGGGVCPLGAPGSWSVALLRSPSTQQKSRRCLPWLQEPSAPASSSPVGIRTDKTNAYAFAELCAGLHYCKRSVFKACLGMHTSPQTLEPLQGSSLSPVPREN